MFCYNCLLRQIFSREVPFDGYSPYEIRDRVTSGKRPKVPSVMDGCPENIRLLMQECWKDNSFDRPSFDSIYKSLESLRDSLSNEIYYSASMVQSVDEIDSLSALMSQKKK